MFQVLLKRIDTSRCSLVTSTGGAQLQPLTLNPPTHPPTHLKRAKMFRRSGPHLVQIWRQKKF